MRAVSLLTCASGRVATAALALCLAPAFLTGARAADGNEGKWYIGANIPVMFIDNTKTGVNASTALPSGPINYTTNGTTHYGVGFRVGGLVGYYLLPNVRVEGELYYGFARVKKTVYSGTRVTTPDGMTIPMPQKINQPSTGNVTMMGGMVNAWYDIETGSAWSPFVGGGIGIFSTDFGDLKWDTQKVTRDIATPLLTAGVQANLAATQPGLTVGSPQYQAALKAGVEAGLAHLPEAPRPKDKDTVFAYQVGGGVGYRVNDAITVQLSYKFQVAPGLQFDGENPAASVKTKTDMRIHLFEIGFRYQF